MSKKKIVFTAILCLGIILGITGCGEASNPENIGSDTCTPLDYKNGVFYFPCTKAEFGNSVSQFRKQHPDMRIVAMSGDGTGGYGYDRGYFVITESK